jgi:ATP-binding cassette subfamily B protein
VANMSATPQNTSTGQSAFTQKRSEFNVPAWYDYDRRNATRWFISHIREHKLWFFLGLLGFLTGYSAYSYARILIGDAAELIINPTTTEAVIGISMTILLVLSMDGIGSLIGSLSLETLANRVERDARKELYTSLVGKNQTFHDQQRVGDIMARATDDVRQLNPTISPGIIFVFDMVMGFVVPMFFLATIRLELLLVPMIFLVAYVITVREYIKRLDPVVQQQREDYGVMNAGLEETISGIEIVKVAAQEAFERLKFRKNATKYRDMFVKQGQIEAGYLPLLMYGVSVGFIFLHAISLHNQGILSIADIIAVMGLVGVLRFPVFVSLFSLSLIRLGIASSERILHLINQETDIEENPEGHSTVVRGDVFFEDVTFAYEDGQAVLANLSFSVQAGQTVAIVGQTGSGKSTLTQLVSRTYDASQGRVMIDGVDVRDWNLDALRSQISKIEQDVFLFSRTIAENIAFGTPEATQEEIEHAAREAQAHEFIVSFTEGYQTKIGGRGVTLSGGQRQRLALARAFLKNPRILILDDSTSAIDSATEDDIQKAMRRAQEGRTTLLITHRLSQIRWADQIVLLERGRIVAQGAHDDLLQTSQHYQRIFARYTV